MARKSNNYHTPTGSRYKVIIEKNGIQDFMVLYAKDAEDAQIMAGLAWNGTKWKITKVQKEYFAYGHGNIKKMWLNEEEYAEMKTEYVLFETYKEAYDYGQKC